MSQQATQKARLSSRGRLAMRSGSLSSFPPEIQPVLAESTAGPVTLFLTFSMVHLLVSV